MAVGQAFRHRERADRSERAQVRLVWLAAAIATLGVAIPLAMMLDGVLFQDQSYKLWTWPAIPAVWLVCLAAAALSRHRRVIGPFLLGWAATGGAWVFEPEHGLITFGAVWLIAIALYLSQLGILRNTD